MPSKALQMRIREAEDGLRELKERAARLEATLEVLQRHLEEELAEESPGQALPEAETAPPAPLTGPAKPRHEGARPAPTPPPLPPAGPEPIVRDTPVRPTESAPLRPEPVRAAARQTTGDAEVPLPSVRIPAAAPTPAANLEREGLELQLGRVWFVRIGIGLLLTGIVFLSTYAYQNFIITWPAGLRVAFLYAISAILAGSGFFLERWKEDLRNYGRVVTAGGWAAAYYTTYAAHHVERLRVIEDPVTAAVLLTLCALAFFVYAAWRKSSLLTVGALALAFYSIAINPMGALGCFSGLLLGAIAMFFFIRFRWMQTGLAALLGAYLSYAYWQGLVNVDTANDATRWFLVAYWLLFMTGVLVPQAKQNSGRFLAAFASLNNAFFFALFSFDLSTPGWVPDLWLNALVFGGLLIVISAVAARLPGYPKLLWQVLLPQGLALVTWGLSIKLTGYHLFVSLTLEALVLAAMWRRSSLPTFRVFAWISAGIAIACALFHIPWFGSPAPHLAHLIEGALLAVLAFLMRGAPFLETSRNEKLSVEAILAAFFALVIPSLGIFPDFSMAASGLWMMATGLALWGIYMAAPARHPLPELTWLAQPFAVVGACFAIFNSPSLLQLVLATVVVAVLFHLHGWAADRKRETCLPEASRWMEGLFTLLTVVSLGLLVDREVGSSDAQILVFGALAILLHTYGSLAGRTIMAGFAHAFYLPVIALWSAALELNLPEGPGKVALLGSLALVLSHLVLVHLWKALRFTIVLREAFLILATLLWIAWTANFIDAWWLVLAWTGCGLAFLPKPCRTLALTPCYAGLLVLALIQAGLLAPGDFLLRYLTVPAVFVVHLLQRDPYSAPDRPAGFTPMDGLGVLGVFSLAAIASQHTLEAFDGNGLSICWALLGLGFFGLGLATQQRVYRLSGLLLLGASLGHVLLVDVWKLGTLLRILSFLTLGLVLLALGFVYNRWSDTLRRLL